MGSITSADKAHQRLYKRFSEDVEEVYVIALGPDKTELGLGLLFKGTVDACMVHMRDIYRFAIRSNASSIIVAHNHPSGDLTASKQDLEVTARLIKSGQLVGIPCEDHIIITSNGFNSLRESTNIWSRNRKEWL